MITGRVTLTVAAAAVVVAFTVPVNGATVGSRFLASLRIAKPKAVSAATPGGGTGRQLQTVILGILAETTSAALDQPDVSVPNVDSASRLVGFRVTQLGGRTDVPKVSVLGARQATVQINREQVRTLFTEAGRPSNVPASLNGLPASIQRPRAVRAEYGNCPVPVANTIQGQIQGPPPPSTDNGNCVLVSESPLPIVLLPGALDTAGVMEIALELEGMSPKQTRDFRSLFDWRSALALSLPRFFRSYEIVNVGPARGMLVITAGRREPAYTLLWVHDGIAYSVAGYGSSGDAVPFATSLR